jgi:DNA-binding NarL/FixJ family response regulator
MQSNFGAVVLGKPTMKAEKKNPIRVVLADDHPIPMAGFSMTLVRYGVEVIGEAKTPEEAEKMYSSLSPDVLVMDIRFGEKMTGLDAAKHILQKYPDAKIVFLSQFDQDSLIKETYKIGGRAFVTKDCEPVDLATAVTRAYEGELFFLPHIAERLANMAVRGDDSPRSLLDERELKLFVLIARGSTISEMANALAVSPKTVSNLIHAVKVKLGLTRSADITRLAVKHGFIEA